MICSWSTLFPLVFIHPYVNIYVYIYMYMFVYQLPQLVQGRFLKVSNNSENYTIQNVSCKGFFFTKCPWIWGPSRVDQLSVVVVVTITTRSPSLRTLSWGDVELDFGSRDRNNRLTTNFSGGKPPSVKKKIHYEECIESRSHVKNRKNAWKRCRCIICILNEWMNSEVPPEKGLAVLSLNLGYSIDLDTFYTVLFGKDHSFEVGNPLKFPNLKKIQINSQP